MRRVLLLLLLIPLVLTACGGSSDTTVPTPPASSAFESSGSSQVDKLIASWREVGWAQMAADGVKAESKVEAIYQTTASLAEIDSHYQQLTNNGWHRLQRLPGVSGDVMLSGYEHGTTALVVGAVDASKFGGTGVVVYTLKGTK